MRCRVCKVAPDERAWASVPLCEVCVVERDTCVPASSGKSGWRAARRHAHLWDDVGQAGRLHKLQLRRLLHRARHAHAHKVCLLRAHGQLHLLQGAVQLGQQRICLRGEGAGE